MKKYLVMALTCFLLPAALSDEENPWKERVAPARERAEKTGDSADYRKALDAAWRADDWAAGRDIATTALEKHPRDESLLGPAARALWRAGLIEQAESLAQRIRPETRDNVALCVLIGVHLSRGEIDSAVSAARQLERVGPRDATEWAYLVGLKMHQNRLEGLADAFRQVERLVSADNGYPEYLFQEAFAGVADFFGKIGSEPVNRIERYGQAPLRVFALINLPGVDTYINGKGPYRLLVDTGGSNMLSIDDAVAKEVGVESIAEALVHGVSGKETSGQALLDEVRMGEIVVRRAPARIFGVRAATAGAADGILGTGVFGDGRFKLDFVKPEMTVAPSSDQPGAGVAVELRIVGDSKLIVPLKLNGKPAVALFDTGADVVVVSPRLLDELHPNRVQTTSIGPIGMGVGKGEEASLTMAPGVDFTVAGREYRNYSGLGLDVLDTLLSPIIGVRIDLLIGMPVFREMQSVTVDLHRSRMWVEWLKP